MNAPMWELKDSKDGLQDKKRALQDEKHGLFEDEVEDEEPP